MKAYSTREAAKKLGISFTSMNRYIADKKIPVPPLTEVARISARVWSEEDIERVRVVLPKIANGRKTRYQKLREKQKAQAGSPVPSKSRKAKKKSKP
jgi:predicted DNA-binding transcriptional regulator AlpA